MLQSVATGPPAEWCAKVSAGAPASAAQSSGGVSERSSSELRSVRRVVEVEHVAVAVDPARPLVAEQRHEAAGLVEARRVLPRSAPELGVSSRKGMPQWSWSVSAATSSAATSRA